MIVPKPVAILLWPFSAIYGLAARIRAWLYVRGWLEQKRLGRPVISVGNLTVGGTGKTPMVMWLAERFLEEGKRVAILSRGYRGDRGSSDEVEVMKRRLGDRVQFGVGADRFAAGRRLEAAGVDLFLLDDGFQHLQLARDVDVVLIDGTRELKREMVLPAGRLREPIAALERANLIMYTRVSSYWETTNLVDPLRGSREFPFFTCQTKLLGVRPAQDRGEFLSENQRNGAAPFFAFCGIGNPDAFFADLQRAGLVIAGEMAFRDHHKYSQADLAKLTAAAAVAGARAVVTTEKDLQNLSDSARLGLPVFATVIDLDVRSPGEFLGAIRKNLARGSVAA